MLKQANLQNLLETCQELRLENKALRERLIRVDKLETSRKAAMPSPELSRKDIAEVKKVSICYFANLEIQV